MIEQAELRRLENMCIQEHAPTCTATCPVHVDVRAMIAEISRGNFAAALKILKKVVPFPGIIGRVCDQPCWEVCKRKEAGESIAIAALERACADLGRSPAPSDKVTPLPRTGRRVAVVGGGLSGLTVAFDLARKGHGVVIFEAVGKLGGNLWEFSEDDLPRQVIADDLAVLAGLGVEVRLNAPVGGDVSLAALRGEFNAVYLGTGASSQSFSLELDEQGRIRVDRATFATAQEGIFAGGRLLHGTEKYSPILSISEGRRAAVSIDRYLQKVSLAAARRDEGSYTTRLYTNTAGIEPLPVVPTSDPRAGYSREEAIAEAQRCLQCQCLECVKVCEYLAHYDSYPKRYLRQIYNNLSIVKGTRVANKFINSCSLCRLCYEVCPEDLDMGAVCRRARNLMVEQKRMPASAHDFALRDMLFSNGEKFALTRNQPGTGASDFLFFPGCQLSASDPEQVARIYAYLRGKLGGKGGVGLMLRCCGAPAEWAGRSDLLQEALAGLLEGYKELGNPRVILACPSCYQVFKTFLPDLPIVSLWELLVELGLPEGAAATGSGVVSVHDPCAARYEPGLQDGVRDVLRQLGYQIKELPLSREKTECCSYGGLMHFVNPEVARKVVERRIEEGAEDYVTYCAMCRDLFAARGKRTLILSDLVFDGDVESRATRRSPSYSQRHDNRAALKRRLLKELWGEEVDGQQEYESIKLDFSAEVQKRLDARLILVEDMQQVISYAEKTGNKLLNGSSGHSLACYRPGSVTYWVEYSPAGDGFVVHTAYSHRMEISKEQIK